MPVHNKTQLCPLLTCTLRCKCAEVSYNCAEVVTRDTTKHTFTWRDTGATWISTSSQWKQQTALEIKR